ncbi:MAG: hypothetical protein HY964_03295 [Ignavibacteriales bacterium]|nr:hypothetical protein [Ignavibacteriales bacterium]
MKRFFISFFILLILLVVPNSYSQDRGFGLGIMIGEPTGLNAKGWLTKRTAIDAGLAWSFVHETALHVHVDYLIHSFNVFPDAEQLPLYYGIGGRIRTGEKRDAQVGLRMVGGIEYMFRTAPIDIFFEIAPILDLTPKTELNMNAGIGARFYFH